MDMKWLNRIIPRALVAVALTLLSVGVVLPGAQPVHAGPADCYWVGGTGNWSDATNHWATVSGGTPDVANTPGSTSAVHFDAASAAAGGQVVTLDANGSCKSMDWTGQDDNMTFTGSKDLNLYGNFTLIAAMTWSHTGMTSLYATSSWTMAGHTLGGNFVIANTNLSLQDAFTCAGAIQWNLGTINTGGFTVTVNEMYFNGGALTLNLGASTFNCTLWMDLSGTTTLTLNAGTSTINVSGAGGVDFAGFGKSYNIVNLTGNAHTITGANTFATLTRTGTAAASTLTLPASVAQTVTGTCTLTGNSPVNTLTVLSGTPGTCARLTAGTGVVTNTLYTDMFTVLGSVVAVTCAGTTGVTFAGGGGTYTSLDMAGAGNYALTVTGSNTLGAVTIDRSAAAKTLTLTAGTNQQVASMTVATAGTTVVTINSTGAAATLTKTGTQYVSLDYLNITNSTVALAGTWYAGAHSTNVSGNTGWVFQSPTALTITTSAASSVSMTKDGVTSGSFNGTSPTYTDQPYIGRYFEYGLTAPAYGSTTAAVYSATPGAYSAAIPAGLSPGSTYHFRAVGINGAGSFAGSDATFTFTMPTIVTNIATDVKFLSGTTATLNGTISAMGTASSCYVYFQWDDTGSYSTTTATQTKSGTGTFSQVITGFDPLSTIYYRPVVKVGTYAVAGTGATTKITGGMVAGYGAAWYILPALLAVGVFVKFKKDGQNLEGIAMAAIVAVLGVIIVRILMTALW